MASAFRIRRSDQERVARSGQADVSRAMEMLGAEAGVEEACIQGSVQEIRRRLDTVLDDLLPPAARPGLAERLLHWAGLGLRARAADAALATLLHETPPGTRHVAVCFGASVRASGERVSPGQVMREHVADALDDAYCVLLPHEAAQRAELRRAFWASAREGGRKREFIARAWGGPARRRGWAAVRLAMREAAVAAAADRVEEQENDADAMDAPRPGRGGPAAARQARPG